VLLSATPSQKRLEGRLSRHEFLEGFGVVRHLHQRVAEVGFSDNLLVDEVKEVEEDERQWFIWRDTPVIREIQKRLKSGLSLTSSIAES